MNPRARRLGWIIALAGACSFDPPGGGSGERGDGPPIDPRVDGGAVIADGPGPTTDAVTFDAAPTCPGAYVHQAGLGCYRVVTASTTWVTAELACEADGGHLVVIGNPAENALVHGLLAGSNGWIGASDRAVRGFVWVTREPPGYSAWDDGEPNDGGLFAFEDCVEMFASNRWNDNECDEARPSVCEHDGLAADPTAY